jgi:hypothetical protein
MARRIHLPLLAVRALEQVRPVLPAHQLAEELLR